MELYPESLKKIKAIEEQYGKGIKSVVLDFRKENYKHREIAKALGLVLSSYNNWKKCYGWSDGKIMRANKTYLDTKARQLGFENCLEMVRVLKGRGRSVEDIAERLDCKVTSLFRYVGRHK